MIYHWLIGGLTALDLGVKNEIEREEDNSFPRKLECSKGWITLHKHHNEGFPFGFLKERPDLVKGIPLAVTSAAAGAFSVFCLKKGNKGQKLGLSLVLAGAFSNLYDRLVRGYVVDYFTIEWKPLKDVIFNLGDLFVFLGAAIFTLSEAFSDCREKMKKD